MSEENNDLDVTDPSNDGAPNVQEPNQNSPAPVTELPPAIPNNSAELAEIEALKKEAAAQTAELAKLKAAEKKRADDELGELEKTKKHLEEAQAAVKLQTERSNLLLKEAAIQREASAKGGAARLATITKLIDLSAVTITEDGTVEGVTEAVASVVESVPELFEKKSTQTSDPTTGDGKGSDRKPSNDDGYETEQELGSAIAKNVKEKKNHTRL